MQTVVAKRVNAAKPLTEHNVASSTKTFGGSRKMTILSCGNSRQKALNHSFYKYTSCG